MYPNLTWPEITLRLALTLLAGALIGFNRGEHGAPAGLRTTMLVGLAASVAMIQTNLLLPSSGRASDSFIMMDLMRLPLGILSGMGFIGAGAIIHKNNLVGGVTTAATLWYVTVMGLCFGGGQIVLGLIMLGLGVFTLSGLKWFEARWRQDRHASLSVTVGIEGPTDKEISKILQDNGFKIASLAVNYTEGLKYRELNCVVRWRGHTTDIEPPAFLNLLARQSDIEKMSWLP